MSEGELRRPASSTTAAPAREAGRGRQPARSMRDPELWQRLESFTVDDASSQWRFVDRLADENGWARSYAEEVYEEYLKFVYLMAVAGDVLTPSDPVDQAWHLHLAYSESYWQRLCGDVVGRRIHHGPTRGGRSSCGGGGCGGCASS